jgi:hypothetical protein
MEKGRPELRLIKPGKQAPTKATVEYNGTWRCPVCAGEGKDRRTLILAYSNAKIHGNKIDLRTALRGEELRCATCQAPAAVRHENCWQFLT